MCLTFRYTAYGVAVFGYERSLLLDHMVCESGLLQAEVRWNNRLFFLSGFAFQSGRCPKHESPERGEVRGG